MNNYKKILLLAIGLTAALTSCKKLVEIPAPSTSLSSGNIYKSEAFATAALIGIYTRMADYNAAINGPVNGWSVASSLAADELDLAASRAELEPYYQNALYSGLSDDAMWTRLYSFLYPINAAIEGLNASSLNGDVKNQLLGEARFLRALHYFYLANYYGDAALATTTDYKVNEKLGRSPKAEVYSLILEDLKAAKGLLKADYVGSDSRSPVQERIRPNRATATALLARVYLYTGDWVNAEKEAGEVLSETGTYELETTDQVFAANSREAIWQLQSTGFGFTTPEAVFFRLDESGVSFDHPAVLSAYLLNSFESGDQRKIRWVAKYTDTQTSPSTDYFYPVKYRIYNGDASSPVEALALFRLAELYLIRAEARVQQGRLTDAVADLDKIRHRAGLNGYSGALDGELIRKAIIHERQVELFTEQGHRWMDIKRSKGFSNPAISLADETMPAITAKKGGSWKSEYQYWPIPDGELQRGVNLKQTPGY